jgi:hypothetical protein
VLGPPPAAGPATEAKPQGRGHKDNKAQRRREENQGKAAKESVRQAEFLQKQAEQHVQVLQL